MFKPATFVWQRVICQFQSLYGSRSQQSDPGLPNGGLLALWLLNVAAFWSSISKWLRLCKISEWFGMNPHCPIANKKSTYGYLRAILLFTWWTWWSFFFTSTLHQVVYWYRKDGQMATRILDHSIGPGFSCSWEDLNNAPWPHRSLRTHWWEFSKRLVVRLVIPQ